MAVEKGGDRTPQERGVVARHRSNHQQLWLVRRLAEGNDAAEGPLPHNPFRHWKAKGWLGVGPRCAFEQLAGGSKGATARSIGEGIERIFTRYPRDVGNDARRSEGEMRRFMQQVQHMPFSLRP